MILDQVLLHRQSPLLMLYHLILHHQLPATCSVTLSNQEMIHMQLASTLPTRCPDLAGWRLMILKHPLMMMKTMTVRTVEIKDLEEEEEDQEE